jgi:hypothetical protein
MVEVIKIVKNSSIEVVGRCCSKLHAPSSALQKNVRPSFLSRTLPVGREPGLLYYLQHRAEGNVVAFKLAVHFFA